MTASCIIIATMIIQVSNLEKSESIGNNKKQWELRKEWKFVVLIRI